MKYTRAASRYLGAWRVFRVGTGEADLSVLAFPGMPFCVTLSAMGSKDKGRKEVKKAPKPKPKPEPARREIFTPAPPK